MEPRTPPEPLGIMGGSGTMTWHTGNPVREGATVTDDMEGQARRYHCNRVVVGAVVKCET